MASYLFKLLGFLVFSVFVIAQYYGVSFHNESGTGYVTYAITLLIIYGIYKAYWLTSLKSKVSFSPVSIGLYTLLHIFVLSFVYFGLVGASSGGFVLFSKILGYTFLPFLITIVSYSCAKKLIAKVVPAFRDADVSFRFLAALGFGFVLFLTSLTILGSMGFYNLWSVFGILVVFGILSYRELLESFVSLWSYSIEFPNHRGDGSFLEQINLPLLSTELLFLILTYLVSVNFINIIRPMPIGWDDLGVYMNFPQIMANGGVIIKGVGMTAWQTLTGIGFMFHSAPQAFFMNQIGGILSVIVLAVAFGSLLKDQKKSLINLPLLGTTMFYAMPMVIFQQAKDMKLDPGLFFVSCISIYGITYLLLEYKKSLESDGTEKSDGGILHFFDRHHNLFYVLLFGMVAGLAFAIKFTTLMLILGLIGVVFYAKLGLGGFFGYFSLFIAVFTQFRLWGQLNVNYPKDDTALLQQVTIGSVLLAAIFFGYAWKKHHTITFKKAFLVTLVFIVGIAIPVAPWIVKNISETGLKDITVSAILGGKWDVFTADLTKIYTPTELKIIDEKNTGGTISSSGKSTNEDLGRYFGYEDGINNYLKLPLNLTMQSNQPGEYTEITYFYLALIPVVFLFLAYNNPLWIIGLGLSMLFEVLYFFFPGVAPGIISFFANQSLPGGYIAIALFSLFPLVYYTFALGKDKKSELFKLNLVFASMYILIFIISAYGIVWYGISMYFSLLLAILIGGWYVSAVSDATDSKENIIRFFGSIVLLAVTTTYFFASSIPHGWNNLKAAGFNEFKSGQINQEEGIFGSHPDYFAILVALNLKDEKSVFDTTMTSIQNDILKKLVANNLGTDQSLKKLESILREISHTDLTQAKIDQQTAFAVQKETRSIVTNLYETVLYPPLSLQNTAGIYRIGTFLTYFISNNRQRYYDDSLVMNFGQYFYDTDPNTAISRMEKLGLKYLLVDLNAATIDKDPRHDLTRRYEDLLKTFRSDKLELIQTDSMCLQMALEEKDPATYLTYAGVNYESYTKDASGAETSINRGQKQLECYNHILDLMKNNKIDTDHFSFLLPLTSYLSKNPPKDQQAMLQIFQNYINHGWLALFRIK